VKLGLESALDLVVK